MKLNLYKSVDKLDKIKYSYITQSQRGDKMSFERDETLTADEHMANYVRELAAIETAMEPYKEQKRDLRGTYSENGWLTKEEIRMAVKAYRLVKSDTDMEQLTEYFNKLKRTVRKINA